MGLSGWSVFLAGGLRGSTLLVFFAKFLTRAFGIRTDGRGVGVGGGGGGAGNTVLRRSSGAEKDSFTGLQGRRNTVLQFYQDPENHVLKIPCMKNPIYKKIHIQ